MGRNSLAPGFRFHPTDEELVRYYLKRKVCEKPLLVDPITVVDIYKCEPWELPEKSKLKTGDLEWYFFSGLDKKYGNGSRTNRATEKGYWKTTGKDRPIRKGALTVGMKKTLVYHSGRAPKGARSNWVMHEYRLEDEELVKAGVAQDSYVLCRIFQKSGTGPKNGEQYGAPFIEEEWEDNVMAIVPGEELPGEELPYGEGLVEDGAFTDGNEFEQGFGTAIPAEGAVPSDFYNVDNGGIYVDQFGNFTEPEQPLPINFYRGETSNYVEPSEEFSEADLKPLIGGEASDLGNGQTLFESPLNVMDPQPVKEEYFVQSSNEVGEQFLDAFDGASFGDGLYLETNDLSKPIDQDSTDFDLLDQYLTYFEAEDGNIEFPETQNAEIFAIGEAQSAVPMGTQQVVEAHDIYNSASSSNQNADLTHLDSDFKSPLVKHANQMLGSIPAPPAIALEFPSKEALLRLNSASQASSSSVHVTAGMITIRNLNRYGNETDWTFGKNGNVDLVLSYYGLPEADTEGSSKTGSVVAKGWFMFMFIWVLIMSLSFKVGSFIYTKSCFDR